MHRHYSLFTDEGMRAVVKPNAWICCFWVKLTNVNLVAGIMFGSAMKTLFAEEVIFVAQSQIRLNKKIVQCLISLTSY